MRVCLNCGAEVSPAGSCANCGARVCFSDSSDNDSPITESLAPPDKLVLLQDGRKVSGVCVGIARRFGLPIWLIRTLFIIPGAFWLMARSYIWCSHFHWKSGRRQRNGWYMKRPTTNPGILNG